jgi:hypothetical protein
VLVFGGPLAPLGDSIAFVELELDAAVDAYREWGTHWPPPPPTLTALPQAPVEELLRVLLPLEMRHRRRLLVGTTTGWTAVFDNSSNGGDPFPPTYLAEIRGVRAVAATHTSGPIETCPATQFHLFGPEGEPPLLYVRTIDAGVFDEGRWHFETSGAVQPFEETEAYASRRVRDRFTREMLLRYLAALEVHADDPAWYRDGVLATP